jgi:trimethylamine--corrinoid protein Co-methyltransferase
MVDFFDPQTMLINLACAELMDHYKIPHAGTSGSANGWGADLIASEALCINQLTSCIGKVGLAPFVGGTLGSKVFSPEVVVYTNEQIEQARNFSIGFLNNEESIALNDLITFGAGGNFISAHRTMKLFREAYYSSNIFPRPSFEKWQEMGQPEARRFLRDRTLDSINNSNYPADQQELLSKGEEFISLLKLLHRKNVINSFDSNRFGEISGLVDIQAALCSNVIGKQLEGNDGDHWTQHPGCIGYP